MNGIIAISIAIAGYFAAMLAARLARSIVTRFLEPGLAGFVTSIVRTAVLLFTLKLIIDQTGAAGVLVILATAITAAFALGSERIASDVVAGINLFMLRYYRVGDLVTIGSNRGHIINISLTHTSMSNGERDKIIIPNSEVLGQVIVNHAGIPGARLRASIKINGVHNREELMDVMLESAKMFEPQLRGPDDLPTVDLKNINRDGGANLSEYIVQVIVPESLYGSHDKLFLHLTRALDTRASALQQSAAA